MNEHEAPLAFDRNYVYRRFEPQAEVKSQPIVALHGSATDESTIYPLARLLDPDSRVIAPRGRIIQNGDRRWYRKTSAIAFDQNSVRFEAEAFATFLKGLTEDRLIDPASTLYMGYSNGANLLASVMLLHPGLIRRAVLLRSMPVLEDPPRANLSSTRVLILGGATDGTYGSYSAVLDELLRRNGAAVDRQTIKSGHEFGVADVKAARRWLDSFESDPGAVADSAPVRT